jgi:hypothetical protein
MLLACGFSWENKSSATVRIMKCVAYVFVVGRQVLAGAETRHDDRTAANGERCGCDDGRLNGLFRRLRSAPETILTFGGPFGGRLFVYDQTVGKMGQEISTAIGTFPRWHR